MKNDPQHMIDECAQVMFDKERVEYEFWRTRNFAAQPGVKAYPGIGKDRRNSYRRRALQLLKDMGFLDSSADLVEE